MGTVGKTSRAIGLDEETNGYFIGKKLNLEALEKFSSYTRINELVHAPWVPFLGYETAKSLSEGNYGNAIFNGTFLLLNTSCIMLQRYNRVKVNDAIDRKKKKAQAT